MSKLTSTINKTKITKMERFIESLIFSGRKGVAYLEVALRIEVNTVSNYARLLRAKGINLETSPKYRLTNFTEARAALDLINNYRLKRGCPALPNELLEAWL